MTPQLPTITAFFGAMLGLLGGALTANVISHRLRTRTMTGDGGNPGLGRAMRAHGNFVEQAPLALILLALAELVAVRPLVVAILGVLVLATRIAAAYGLNRSLGVTDARRFGGAGSIIGPVATSLAVLLALAGIR